MRLCRVFCVFGAALLGAFTSCAEPLSADALKAELRRVNMAALRAAITDLAATYPHQYPHGQEFLDRLAACENQIPAVEQALTSGDAAALEHSAQTIRELLKLQREALIANPLVSGQPVLFVVRAQYKEDHHNTATMFQMGEINTASFAGGGALKAIDLARDGAVQTLLESPEGIIRDPEVHFDGARIVFSMRNGIEDDYHVYEIGADGTGLRQLTRARGVTDIDPLYLPDDAIAFSSTREPKYCMCNRHIMANLFRMEADGANIVQIGKSTLFEGHGALMPDGRLLYYRWEYVDRNFGDAQGLWTVNPDGTNHAVYWGNNTQSPGAAINARPIPGAPQVVCVFGSCHDRPWGALAIVDRRLGLDGRPPVVRTWPADAINLVGNGEWDRFNFDTFKGANPKYEDPYPLSDKYFLCSRITGEGERMGLYLIDVFGNEILLHVEGPGCYDPMPLGPRPRPPVIPMRRDFENKDGYFYVVDVYRGTHMQGVARGAAKFLRVVESPEKRFWTHPSWNGQGQEAPAMNWHDFNNKRILGTVPVEADGSAYFAVPSDRFVYFQLLDEQGMMIQSMRSGTMIQSGERQGCVGCHEERRAAPPTEHGSLPMALRRAPSGLAGWHGAPRMFSYVAEVQPVFDKHCVGCHDYGQPAAKKLNLAADRTVAFNTSYEELWRKEYIHVVGAGPAQTQPAYSWGAHASKLTNNLRARLDDGTIDRESFDRVVTWMDIHAPYYPSYASAYPNHLTGRSPLNDADIKRLTELTGVPLAQLMDCAKKPELDINLDRPELSPCLAKFADHGDPKYVEALAILQRGKQRLQEQPRGDTADFQPCPTDCRHEEKYIARQRIEARVREAIRGGQKVYDGIE